MSWTARKQELTKQAREYNRAAILITKNSWFWRMLAVLISPLMSKDNFLHRFSTTLGPVVASPEELSFETLEILIPHEVGGHVRQFWAFGGFIPYVSVWLGLIPMILLYGLLLPVGFNWFRYRLELHADKQKWRWMIKNGSSELEVMARAESFAVTISSWKYGKPVPEAWALWGFRRAARKVISESK